MTKGVDSVVLIHFQLSVLAGCGAGILKEIFGLDKSNWSYSTFHGKSVYLALIGTVLYLTCLTYKVVPAADAKNYIGLLLASISMWKYCPVLACPAVIKTFFECSKSAPAAVAAKSAAVKKAPASIRKRAEKAVVESSTSEEDVDEGRPTRTRVARKKTN